ncbi:MAG TPA: M48 family metallopeptidase [Candidatus Saccharimonadales bacterium]|nr:M48 family metallopeptidase [Candidatus Saccharimonadales bacterium]
MGLFIVIIAGLGWVFSNVYGEPFMLYGALIVGVLYALIQYFAGSRLALAVTGAQEITKKDSPRLYRAVENLAITTGMPMPKVYIMNEPGLNAFATGRDPKHASVAVTKGMLEILDAPELEAVLAHELGHIKNYDIRVMMIVFGLVSAIGFIADMLLRMTWFTDRERNSSPLFLVLGLVAAILAPFIAVMVQLAVSRQREYLADGTSVLTTRYPDGLIRALEKIRDHGSAIQHQNTATAHFFFANPLKSGGFSKLFSTHPPIEDRIARLKAMGDTL